jgi:hypothetical protein
MTLTDAIAANLLSPPILFFALGIIAALVKSDLKFPEAFYSALTIYLLTAIGFKGGVAIHEAGLSRVWKPALAAISLSALIPLWCFAILRKPGRLPVPDAASPVPVANFILEAVAQAPSCSSLANTLRVQEEPITSS